MCTILLDPESDLSHKHHVVATLPDALQAQLSRYGLAWAAPPPYCRSGSIARHMYLKITGKTALPPASDSRLTLCLWIARACGKWLMEGREGPSNV